MNQMINFLGTHARLAQRQLSQDSPVGLHHLQVFPNRISQSLPGCGLLSNLLELIKGLFFRLQGRQGPDPIL